MKYGGSQIDTKYTMRLIANELAEANRIKKLEILWGGRAGNMTDKYCKKLMDILEDPNDYNLDVYGDYNED